MSHQIRITKLEIEDTLFQREDLVPFIRIISLTNPDVNYSTNSGRKYKKNKNNKSIFLFNSDDRNNTFSVLMNDKFKLEVMYSINSSKDREKYSADCILSVQQDGEKGVCNLRDGDDNVGGIHFELFSKDVEESKGTVELEEKKENLRQSESSLVNDNNDNQNNNHSNNHINEHKNDNNSYSDNKSNNNNVNIASNSDEKRNSYNGSNDISNNIDINKNNSNNNSINIISDSDKNNDNIINDNSNNKNSNNNSIINKTKNNNNNNPISPSRKPLPAWVSLLKNNNTKTTNINNTKTKNSTSNDNSNTTNNSISVSDQICRDLRSCEKDLAQIRVRLKSVFLASPSPSVWSDSAVVRLSVSPIPGKATTLRSVGPAFRVDNDNNNDNVFEFDFCLKTALLSMGVADTRAKAFKGGVCPSLRVDFQCKDFNASGCLYLCALRDLKDSVLALRLTTEGEQSVTATAVLELYPSESSVDRKDLLVHSQAAVVEVVVLGVAGSALSKVDFLRDCRLRVCLRASGVSKQLSPAVGYVSGSQMVDFSSSCSVSSVFPISDVLEVQVLRQDEKFGEVVVGVVQIPICAIREGEISEPEVHNFWLIQSAEVLGGSGSVEMSKMRLVVQLGKRLMNDVEDKQPFAYYKNHKKINEHIGKDLPPVLTNNYVETDDVSAIDSLKPVFGTANNISLQNKKSMSGQMKVSVQGFLSLKDMKVKLTDSLVMEVALLPEGWKRESGLCSLVTVKKSSIVGIVEWNSSVVAAVTWALEQRQVGNIRLTLLARNNNNSNSKSKGNPSVVICRAIVDLSSIVQCDKATVTLVPMRSLTSSNNSAISMVNNSDILGWALVGLQFQNNKGGVLENKENSIKELWSKILDSRRESSNLIVNKVVSVHFSFASSQLTPSFFNEVSSSESIGFDLYIKVLNTEQVYSIMCTDIIEGSIMFDKQDLVVNIDTEDSLSSLVYIYLYDVVKEVPVGECNFIIPYNDICRGLPVNFELPLKDYSNNRIANMTFSVQSTVRSSETTVIKQPKQVELSCCISKGTIIGSDVEPFFEITYLGVGNNSQKDTPECFKTRTGVTSVNVDDDNLNLKCSLLIPLPKQSSNGPESSDSSHKFSIVCRDASSSECVEVGRALFIVTSNFLTGSQTEEQWITLNPPNPSSKIAKSMSRILMKLITKSSNEGLASCYNDAIGFVSYGLKGFGSPDNPDFLTTASATIDWLEAAKFDEPSVSRFNGDMLLFNDYKKFWGALPVMGEAKAIEFTLKTSASTKIYQSILDCRLVNQNTNINSSLTLDINCKDGRSTLVDNPKLSIETSFVPFSKGKLKIECSKIEIIDSQCFPKTSVNSDVFKGMFRYSVGSSSPNFSFSNSFEVSRKGGSLSIETSNRINGSKSFSPQKETINSPSNKSSKLLNRFSSKETASINVIESSGCKAEISVDTFLFSTQNPSSQSSMVPLCISLFGYDPKFENKFKKLGVFGYVSTSILYYEAVKAAATSKHTSPLTEDDYTFTLSTPVDLFDLKKRKKVAVVYLNVKFSLLNVSENAIRNLRKTNSVSDADELCKLELILKQSFLLADKDNSGSVSMDELCQLIKDSEKDKNKSDELKKAVDLLASLSNDNGAKNKNINDNIQQIFKKLDPMGDGAVTWWEWKNVLRGYIFNHGNQSNYNLVDPWAVTLQAAYDAISAGRSMSNSIGEADDLSFIELTQIEPVETIKYTFGNNLIANPNNSPIQSIPVGNLSLSNRFIDRTNATNSNNTTKGSRDPDIWKSKHMQNIKGLIDANNQHRENLRAMKLNKLRKLFTNTKIAFFLNEYFIPYMKDLQIKRKDAQTSEQIKNSLLQKQYQEKEEKLKLATTTVQKMVRGRTTRNFFTSCDKIRDKLIEEVISEELNSMCRYWKKKMREAITFLQKKHTNVVLLRAFEKWNKISEEIKSAITIQATIRRKKAANIRKKKMLFREGVMLFCRKFQFGLLRMSFLTFRNNCDAIKVALEEKQKAATKIQASLRGKVGRKNSSIQKEERLREKAVTKIQSSIRARLDRKNVSIIKEKLRKENLHRQAVFIFNRKYEKNILKMSFLKLQIKCGEVAIEIEKMKTLTKQNSAIIQIMQAKDKINKNRQTHKEIQKERDNIKRLIKEKNNVIYSNKPDIENAKGYWVALLEKKNNESNNVVNNNYGKVYSIDLQLRLIEVIYIERTDIWSEYKLTFRLFPFDHPSLEWYHHRKKPPPVVPVIDNNSVAKNNNYDYASPLITSRTQDKYVDVEKPSLVDCTKGFFISYTFDIKDNNNNVYGKVVGKDIPKRLIAVNFYYKDDTSTDTLMHKWLPYDHKNMLWHKENAVSPRSRVSAVPKPESINECIGYKVNFSGMTGVVVSVDSKSNTITFDHTKRVKASFDSEQIAWLSIPKPDTIEESVGYRVEVPATSEVSLDTDGDVFSGVVTSVDPSRSIIRIRFNVSEPTSDPDEEEYSWESEDIAWIRRSLRPRFITNCLGCVVEVKKFDETNQIYESDLGLVASVNEEKGLLGIKFLRTDDHRSDTEYHLWQSADVEWRPDIPSTSLIELYNNRPASIREAVGYTVDVANLDPDAETGDLFSGKVISGNERDGLVYIQFETLDGDLSDIEEFPWDSLHIVWRSKRPTSVSDAVGYLVEVPSNDPNATEGDWFQGRVVCAGQKTDSVRVAFLGVDDELIDDFQEFNLHDPKIVWVSKDSSSIDKTNNFLSSVPLNTVRPTTIQQSVGFLVNVRSKEPDAEPGDMFEGTVVGFTASPVMRVRIRFHGEGTVEEESEDIEEIDWDSPDIFWISPGIYNNNDNKKPSSIINAIGFNVFIRDKDVNNNNLITGKVVSVDEKSKNMKIQFMDEDKDFEEINFDSLRVVWVDKSPQNRPTKMKDAVGAVVNIVSKELLPSSEQEVFQGRVKSVDENYRTVKVQFLGEDDVSIEDFEDLHWDSPRIEWVSIIPPSGNNHKNRPSKISEAVGFVVNIRSSESEGDLFEGRVVSVDEKERTVKVQYTGHDDCCLDEVEDFEWSSEDVVWVERGEVLLNNRPRRIEEALGYLVEVRSEDDGENAFFSGKVVWLSRSKGIVRVLFDSLQLEEEDCEDLDWRSDTIDWGKGLDRTHRPDRLEEAVGRRVRVAVLVGEVEEVESDGVLSGVVQSVSPQTESVTVQFGPGGTVVKDFPFDCRRISWDSPSPVAVSKKKGDNEDKQKSKSKTVEVEKPTIEDSTDWLVAVVDSDGTLAGKVVGHSVIGKLLHIQFYDEDRQIFDDEVEELPYNTPGLVWVQKI